MVVVEPGLGGRVERDRHRRDRRARVERTGLGVVVLRVRRATDQVGLPAEQRVDRPPGPGVGQVRLAEQVVRDRQGRVCGRSCSFPRTAATDVRRRRLDRRQSRSMHVDERQNCGSYRIGTTGLS